MHEISSLTWDFPVCICLAIRTFRLVRFFIQCAGIPATTHSTRQKWRWDFGKTSGKCWSRSLAIWAFEVRCYNIASQAKEWKCSNTVKKKTSLSRAVHVGRRSGKRMYQRGMPGNESGWLVISLRGTSVHSIRMTFLMKSQEKAIFSAPNLFFSYGILVPSDWLYHSYFGWCCHAIKQFQVLSKQVCLKEVIDNIRNLNDVTLGYRSLSRPLNIFNL